MERRWGVSLVALLLCAAFLGELVDPAESVEDKCLACQTVAGQIELGLANERPRNHLDLRHRLDSKGQREGKVINYKVSELRVVELLEGICGKFKSYTFRKGDEGREEWIKVNAANLPASGGPDSFADVERQEADTYSKELVSYCGRLMETTDEELTSKIQKGVVKTGDVEGVLCVELSGHCNSARTVNVSSEEMVSAKVRGGSDGEL